MTLKDTWVNGETFAATDENAVATQVNTNTTDIAGKQPSDSDLTAIAALTPSNDDVVQRKAGAWTNRTVAQLKSDLALNNVTNNAQYYAGGTDVAVADGGTGVSTLPANQVLIGNGTSAVTGIGPATAGYILGTSDGTTWQSQPLTRINTTTSSATPAINTDTTDQFNITALAVAITSMTSGLTGTPRDGQKLMIRIKDNGTARAITWGTSFVSSGVATLLATTVISKTHLIGLVYDSAAVKWVAAAVDAVGY